MKTLAGLFLVRVFDIGIVSFILSREESTRTAGLSWLLWDRKTSNACFSRASSIMEEYTAEAAKEQASVTVVGETDSGHTAEQAGSFASAGSP